APLFPGAQQLALLTARGKFLVFGLDEVKQLSGGGRGTVLMGVDAPDTLAQVVPVGAQGLRVAGVYRNKAHEEILDAKGLQPYVGKRARKGRQLDAKPKQPVLSPVLPAAT